MVASCEFVKHSKKRNFKVYPFGGHLCILPYSSYKRGVIMCLLLKSGRKIMCQVKLKVVGFIEHKTLALI